MYLLCWASKRTYLRRSTTFPLLLLVIYYLHFLCSVASLYIYSINIFNVDCYSELVSCMLPLLHRQSCPRISTVAHPCGIKICYARVTKHNVSNPFAGKKKKIFPRRYFFLPTPWSFARGSIKNPLHPMLTLFFCSRTLLVFVGTALKWCIVFVALELLPVM